jgi:hypothetical protein
MNQGFLQSSVLPSHLLRVFVCTVSVTFAACGTTVVEAPETGTNVWCANDMDCSGSTVCLVYHCSNAGVCEGIVPSNPECDDGGSDAGQMCNPKLPRTAASPTGCCPAGCAPLDSPVSGVYCVDANGGGPC